MKKLSAIAVAVALSLLLAGCKAPAPVKPASGATAAVNVSGVCQNPPDVGGVASVPAPAGEQPSDGDQLIRHLGSEPGTLNYLISTDAEGTEILAFIMESLLDMDLTTGALKPLLAEKWEVSPDNLTFTFHLRHGVKFHNGQPFNADDWMFSMDRVMDPKVDAAPMRADFLDMESYKKIDDYTIVVKWKKPYYNALEAVAGLPILPRLSFQPGEDFNRSPYGRHPIGTGPYRFVEWVTGQRIVIERNPDWWGTEKPHIAGIVNKIITDDNVALQVLKKGELDFMPRLMRPQWLEQTNTPDFLARFNKIHLPYPSYSWIGWNMRRPLFQDKRVRQALTMLLNRDLILEKIFRCIGQMTSGPFYSRTPLYDQSIKPWPFDPARAKTLLAEAGWKDTDGDGVLEKDGVEFRFELSFTSQVPEWQQLAELYQQDLKKAGIAMDIRTLEWAVFSQNVQEWKFDACAMAWAMTAHPDLYTLFHSSQADVPGSQNYVGYKNPEVDRLIEENRGEFDEQKRIEYAHQIHRLIHEDQPYTFLLSSERLTAIDKRFHNVQPKPLRPCFKYDEWYVPAAEQKYLAAPGP